MSSVVNPAPAHHSLIRTIGLVAAFCAMFAASYPPLGAWPLALISIAPLIWAAMHAATTRRLVLAVLACQFLMWLWMNHWMYDVTAAGYPVLGAYLGIYPAVFAWIVRRVGRHPRLGRWPMTLIAPLVWTGVEFLRGEVIFDGYPWFLLGHPLIQWPLLVQSTDLLGVYGATMLAAMTGGLAVDVMRAMADQFSRRRLILAGSAAGLILLLNAGYGWRALAATNEATVERPIRMLAIQTNLPQDNKIGWSVQQQAIDVPAFMELTRQAAERAGAADLIVWPETMVPGIGLEPQAMQLLDGLGQRAAHLTRWGRELAALGRELDTPLLVGSIAWVDVAIVDDGQGSRLQRQREFNSAYLIDRQPPYQRYDKVFLTPFGETMPYISNWPWLEERLLALGAQGMSFSLDASPTITRLRLEVKEDEAGPARWVNLATPICFEDTSGRVCRRMAHQDGQKVADVFVNLSNDGWFGQHDAVRLQHAQIARFRCIENRLPMLRAVNTGWTMAVDSAGRVMAPGPAMRTAGHLAVDLRPDSRRTMYGRIGDLAGWMSAGATAAMAVMTIRRRRGESAGEGIKRGS